MYTHPPKTTSLPEKLKWQDGSCTDAPKSMPGAEVFAAFFTHAFRSQSIVMPWRDHVRGEPTANRPAILACDVGRHKTNGPAVSLGGGVCAGVDGGAAERAGVGGGAFEPGQRAGPVEAVAAGQVRQDVAGGELV